MSCLKMLKVSTVSHAACADFQALACMVWVFYNIKNIIVYSISIYIYIYPQCFTAVTTGICNPTIFASEYMCQQPVGLQPGLGEAILRSIVIFGSSH